MITKESWLKSILAGLFIGIGGIAYLSVENKVVGAALFAVGLFTIVRWDITSIQESCAISWTVIKKESTFFG